MRDLRLAATHSKVSLSIFSTKVYLVSYASNQVIRWFHNLDGYKRYSSISCSGFLSMLSAESLITTTTLL